MDRNLQFILSLLCILALMLPACTTSRGGGDDDDAASNDDDAVADDDDDDDDDVVGDDDDAASDDDDTTGADQTPCADDSWSGFDCNPLSQEPCDLTAGEACDVAIDQSTGGLDNFTCYPAPNVALVGEACDAGAGPWCAGGATCVPADASGTTFVCATFCCDDNACVGGTTCQVGGQFAPAASDLGVCL